MADDYVLTHGGFRANSVVFEALSPPIPRPKERRRIGTLPMGWLEWRERLRTQGGTSVGFDGSARAWFV